MKAVEIQWQPERNESCWKEHPEWRTYGEIGGQEVAMVRYEEFTNREGQLVKGWYSHVYLKPWPKAQDEDNPAATKEEAQAKCQRAVEALTLLLTTGEASDQYRWL